MQNNKTKAMTQGAVMLALFTIFFVIALYVPLISLIAFLIAPIPIAWYAANYSRQQSILLGVVALILSFLFGNLVGPGLAIIFIVTGIVLGDGIRQKNSKVYLFMSTGVSILITFAILFVVSTKFMGVNFITEGIELFKTSYKETLEYTAKQSGQDVPLDQMMQMFDYIEMTIPASITLGVFLLSFLMMNVTLITFKRLKMEVPQFEPFKNMRLPKAVLWYYLIVLTINLFMRPEVGSTLYVITLNMSVVLWVLLTIQGISLFFYMIHAFKYPSFFKVLAVFMSIPLYSFVVLVGIVDLGFNVRQFIDEKNQK